MIDLKSKKAQIIIGAAGALIVVLALIIGLSYKKSSNNTGDTARKNNGFVETDTKKMVPKGAYVPEVDQQTNDKDLAVPKDVVSAAPDVDAKMRQFEVSANGGVFTPSKISVRKGDTVRINIASIDKDYDFVLPDFGMKQIINKGTQRIVEFQATNEGQYVYYCEKCGGIDSNAKGTITIVP